MSTDVASDANRMTRYAAFLRAINVGGRVVKMDHLRRLFSEMGFDRVETIIASGNVVFTAGPDDRVRLERSIEAGLEKALGYRVETFLRTPEELRQVVDSSPYRDVEADTDNVVYVAFTGTIPAAEARRRVLALKTEAHDFHVEGRDVYWLRRRSLDTSRFSGATLEKALGQPATVRNLTTVRRIAQRGG